MNFPWTITIALVLINTLAECTTKVKDKSIDDVLPMTESTTPIMSLEERDESEDFNLMGVMVECNDSFRVEMAYLESFNKSGSFPDETDKTPKCFMRCVLEKSGIASPASQFDVKRTTEIFSQIRDIPEKDIMKIATDCTDRPETCKCERSYQYLKCLMETVIDKYETKLRK